MKRGYFKMKCPLNFGYSEENFYYFTRIFCPFTT